MAVVCRSEWGWMLFSARAGASFAATSTYFCSRNRTPNRVNGVPRLFRKTFWSVGLSE